jgi:hypothetical protein
MRRDALGALGPGLALAGLALLQPWLEQTMVTHMAVEIPLIFAIGWYAGSRTKGRATAWLAMVNGNGLTGLTLATAVSAFWMLPIALDAAVLSPTIGWAKVASVLLAGWLTRLSIVQARTAVQAFFVLNWVWMTGAAGAVYQQVPERLCSTYLLGDQSRAGVGLVVIAVAVAMAWVATAFRDRPD